MGIVLRLVAFANVEMKTSIQTVPLVMTSHPMDNSPVHNNMRLVNVMNLG